MNEEDFYQKIVFAIPVVHVLCHGLLCNMRLHPYLLRGNGLDYGEGTEWMWSMLQGLASRTTVLKQIPSLHKI